MTTTCKNCNNNFEGNYCNNCGQDAHTHAINWHYLVHDVQHGIFHVDKGLFFTLKELYTRPGATIREFLEGKRVKHFKPVAMVFLLATVYGVIYHYLKINPFSATSIETPKGIITTEMLNEWIGSHYALVSLITIPVYSFATKIFFRKSGYNYVEHLVINSFITGQKLLMHFVFLPVEYYLNGSKTFDIITLTTLTLDFAITIWAYSTLFKSYKKRNIIIRSVIAYIIATVLMGILMNVAILIYTIIGMH